MPYIEPETLESLAKSDRKKMEEAAYERTVLGYAFSWKALAKLAKRYNIPTAEIQACIVGYSTDDTKVVRESLNEDIAFILNGADIKTVRHSDPFGRPKDFILMEGTSTSFSKQKAMDILVRDCRVKADKVAEIFESATSRSSYVTVQARDVKEGEDNG